MKALLFRQFFQSAHLRGLQNLRNLPLRVLLVLEPGGRGIFAGAADQAMGSCSASFQQQGVQGVALTGSAASSAWRIELMYQPAIVRKHFGGLAYLGWRA